MAEAVTEEVDRFERCSVQATRRGDPMIGSAFPADRLLLVEQPGPWGRTGLLASRFDGAVAHLLVARLEARGIRVVAIRRPGRHQPDGPRRWAAVDCRPGRERVIWGRFDDDRQLLDVDVPGVLNAPGTGGATEPLYLVCAHGTHDACCAIRGRPVAGQLLERRPGRVWECSHVGGDRFAANLLVLPAGLLYGRVQPEDAGRLVELTDAGRVDAVALRGRVGFPPAEQAALQLAHRESPDAGWREVTVQAVDRRIEERVVVTLSVAGTPMVVAVDVRRADPAWLTCQASAPGRALVYRPSVLAE
ncbi:sucrase ferredoxin [Nakamurella sp.]|uniref:sucrase ferredoxin n=1 Tax=Nakamurella sp. TaxID=1869182 RepID=UPI003B3BAD3D